MADKRIIRRKNRPLNIFADGGPAGSITSGLGTDVSRITQLSQGGASGSAGIQPAGGSSGGFNMGSTGGIGSSVGTIVNAGISNAQIADTSGIEEDIKSQREMTAGASSNDELLNEWSSWNRAKDDYTWKEVRGGSNGQRAMNTISATASGAATGASVGGPVGAIVGGVVGLGSSLAGWFTGNRKAKKKAKKLNKQAKEANEKALSSFETRAENIDTQSDLNMSANYSAFGGVLGGGAIDYELATKALNNKQLNAMSKFRMPSMPNSFEVSESGVNYFAKGGNLSRDKDYDSKKKPYPMVPADDFAGPHRSYPIPTKANARDALRLAGLHGNESVRRKVLAKYPSLKKAYGGMLFADNARGWNHADGGYMGYSYDENYAPTGTLYTGAYDSLTTHPDALTNGGVFSDGVTVVGEGGSHEGRRSQGRRRRRKRPGGKRCGCGEKAGDHLR